MPKDISDVQVREDLNKAQVMHVQYLESWPINQPLTVAGVNVVQVLNYEMIQILNHLFMYEYLNRNQENTNA
jgi:hypothetical protein